jgi:hypothetical protein
VLYEIVIQCNTSYKKGCIEQLLLRTSTTEKEMKSNWALAR